MSLVLSSKVNEQSSVGSEERRIFAVGRSLKAKYQRTSKGKSTWLCVVGAEQAQKEPEEYILCAILESGAFIPRLVSPLLGFKPQGTR